MSGACYRWNSRAAVGDPTSRTWCDACGRPFIDGQAVYDYYQSRRALHDECDRAERRKVEVAR